MGRREDEDHVQGGSRQRFVRPRSSLLNVGADVRPKTLARTQPSMQPALCLGGCARWLVPVSYESGACVDAAPTALMSSSIFSAVPTSLPSSALMNSGHISCASGSGRVRRSVWRRDAVTVDCGVGRGVGRTVPLWRFWEGVPSFCLCFVVRAITYC